MISYIRDKIFSTNLYRHFVNRSRNLQNQIFKLQEENKALKSKVRNFYESRSSIETNISAVKTENRELKKWLDHEKQSRQELENRLLKLKNDNTGGKSSVEKLNQRINSLLNINKKLAMSLKDREIAEQNLKIQILHLSYLKTQLLKDYQVSLLDENDLRENRNINPFMDQIKKNLKREKENNEMFTLWISDDHTLPEIQQLSLSSMMLTGHSVTLYTYEDLENVPDGIEIRDANRIIDESEIFTYNEGFNKGSYSGFANVFRYNCMDVTAKSWFDCDIIAIKNINEIYPSGNIISSQYNVDKTIYPNNGFLRLARGDKLIKSLIKSVNSMDLEHVKHGETGPQLLNLLMGSENPEHYKYLTDPNFVSPINYFDYEDYLKPSKEIVPTLKLDEIWGFHVWNAMFRENGHQNEETQGGFYHDLKQIILSSHDQKQYNEQLKNFYGRFENQQTTID